MSKTDNENVVMLAQEQNSGTSITQEEASIYRYDASSCLLALFIRNKDDLIVYCTGRQHQAIEIARTWPVSYWTLPQTH